MELDKKIQTVDPKEEERKRQEEIDEQNRRIQEESAEFMQK